MNIPFHKPYITEDEINAVAEMMRAGWLTMGGKTIEFENEFKKYIGTSNAVSVNSATAALHLSLISIDLKEHDEVIMPAMTFASTAEVVRYLNAVPVLVDIEKNSSLIDVSKIESKITKKTKAIMPVHFAGQPCDMDEIKAIAEKYNIYVIEDAAHTLPSWYKNRKIGSIGDITCFSFYATKTLTTGEGGMICTENDEWTRRMETLRLHGITRDAWKRYSSSGTWKYDLSETGYKYNTNDIASAIGLEQLKKLEFMWEKRKAIAEKYNNAFKGMEELYIYEVKPDRITSWYLYPLKLHIEALSISRDRFIDEMKKRGIGLSVHFIPLYRFSYYEKMGYNKERYENSDWVFDRSVSLPIFPGMTDNEVQYVIDNIIELVSHNRR